MCVWLRSHTQRLARQSEYQRAQERAIHNSAARHARIHRRIEGMSNYSEGMSCYHRYGPDNEHEHFEDDLDELIDIENKMDAPDDGVDECIGVRDEMNEAANTSADLQTALDDNENTTYTNDSDDERF